MRNCFLIFAMVIYLLGIFSCKEESIAPTAFEFGKQYYPIAQGKFITYKFDSILYDDAGTTKIEKQGYLKEEIGELIEESDTYKKYKLYKYWRQNDTIPWLLTDVETVELQESKVIKTEENLPFIKMVFPNVKNTRWDGNAMFDEEIITKVLGDDLQPYIDWKYKIVDRDITYTINEVSYPNSLEVTQVNQSENNAYRFAYEKYSKGIGMIEKEMKIYTSNHPRQGVPWESYAENGFSIHMTIIDHN